MANKNLPSGTCIGCPCWLTDGTCLKDRQLDHKCRNCKYAHYDDWQGYVCTNSDSEYVADFVFAEHWCEKFTSKEDLVNE